ATRPAAFPERLPRPRARRGPRDRISGPPTVTSGGRPSLGGSTPGDNRGVSAEGHAQGDEAADLAACARRPVVDARPTPRGDPGRIRLVELPPLRVRVRPHPLRPPRPRRLRLRATNQRCP